MVGPLKREIQNLINDGVILTWESYKLESYVTKITQAILNLQEKIEDLLISDTVIDKLLAQLQICKYDSRIIADLLAKIQKIVDEISLKMFSNLPEWTLRLDKKVVLKLIVIFK